MDPAEMDERRSAALDALQAALNELGPITDETRHSIREPVLEIIDLIDQAGKDLRDLDFEDHPEESRSV